MGYIAISIIVPIYNVSKYLRDCLDSLERQVFKDIEVILINDGSTDDSEVIAREYCVRNSNFTLINRNNGGLSAARNTGIEVANGKYICFLDSDDFLSCDALERLYIKLEKDKLDALRYSAYTFEDGIDDYIWKHEDGYRFEGEYPKVLEGTEFFSLAIENDDYYPSCCLIIIRREIIEDNNLCFVEGIIHEDNLFNFELTVLCKRIAVLNEPLYYRRYRAESIIHQKNWMNKIRSMCISAELADDFIKSHPSIKGNICDWMIEFLVISMLNYWELMSRKDQDSKESREYFNRVKPLIDKYLGGRWKRLKLFYISHHLYRLFFIEKIKV